MPQMMPLLWAPLFVFFSLLMILSMLKIYFTSSKTLNFSQKIFKHSENEQFKWTW